MTGKVTVSTAGVLGITDENTVEQVTKQVTKATSFTVITVLTVLRFGVPNLETA